MIAPIMIVRNRSVARRAEARAPSSAPIAASELYSPYPVAPVRYT